MNIPAEKINLHLTGIKQGKTESLRSYIRRFNLERMQIHGLTDGMAFDAFVRGLSYEEENKDRDLMFELIRKKLQTLLDALREAEAYIHASEVCQASRRPKDAQLKKQAGRQENAEAKKEG